MNNPTSIAIQRIKRSPYQTLAAVLIMTMTLFLASAFFLLAVGSEMVLKFFETRPQVNAFYAQEVVPKSQEVDLIKAQVEATGLVEGFNYVSKEEALAIYRELNKNDPLLLEAVTATMLPASLEVSTKDPKDLKTIADLLATQPGIEDVRFAEDIVSNIAKWTTSVRIVGIALVGTHVAITFVIILLIIGIKVSLRRDEIYLLQLLGAGNWYIAAPFIWEGVTYGVSGAFVAWGIAYLVLLYSTPFLVSFLAGLPILPIPVWFMFAVLGGCMVLGAFIGAIGGFAATRRFLKA